jgi:hypothetical protein
MEFFRYRRRAAPVVVDPATGPVAGPPDHRDAFAEGLRQGRREERKRHHGHPILKLVVVLIALAGAAMLAVAAKEGSFSRGGQVVDQNLAVAADEAKAKAAGAVDQTGQAIQNAGATIQQKASDAGGQTK